MNVCNIKIKIYHVNISRKEMPSSLPPKSSTILGCVVPEHSELPSNGIAHYLNFFDVAVAEFVVPVFVDGNFSAAAAAYSEM